MLQFDNLPWEIQRVLFWLRSHWMVALLGFCHFTHSHRRLAAIIQSFIPDFHLTMAHYERTNVVYIKLSTQRRLFYIGSTKHDMFHREQTRNRKFQQLQQRQLAYFEPALKVWYKSGTYWDFVAIPLASVEGDIQVHETALQKQLQPSLNWPWVVPLLKKFRIQRQSYTLTSYDTTLHFGRCTDSSTLQFFVTVDTNFNMPYPTNFSTFDADL